MKTSSTDAGSREGRGVDDDVLRPRGASMGAAAWRAARMAAAPKAGAVKDASEPWKPPKGVRTAPTMQTSVVGEREGERGGRG